MSLFSIIVLDAIIFALIVMAIWFASRQVAVAREVRRRLRGVGAGATAGVTKSATGISSSLFRSQSVKNPFLSFVQDLFLNDSKERQGISQNLHQAGFDQPSAPAVYKTVQFMLAVGLPVLVIIGLQISGKSLSQLQMVMVIGVLCLIGYMGPRYYVGNRAKARKTALENQFPDALDLTVVCVEAGLPLEAAFIRVGGDTFESHPRISEELRTVTQELQAGRTRVEALRGFANRTQVEAVKAFVALLIQTDSLGGSIALSLRTYASEMRNHRMLKAEEKAMRIPVLLSIPLVLCILPVVVTTVMLPAVIAVIRDFAPAMKH